MFTGRGKGVTLDARIHGPCSLNREHG